MKRTKRNIDIHRMPIQLEFDFTYEYEPIDNIIRKVDTIVKKYLKLYDKAMDIWEKLFSDKNTPNRSWKSFRKYQRNLERAANRMISKIYWRDSVSFSDMEWRLKERKGDEHRYAEDMLDAFGFIQEEHDIANGRTEFGMIGYHYFLAEDGISSLHLPECYLRNYYQKYKNNKDYEWERTIG